MGKKNNALSQIEAMLELVKEGRPIYIFSSEGSPLECENCGAPLDSEGWVFDVGGKLYCDRACSKMAQ